MSSLTDAEILFWFAAQLEEALDGIYEDLDDAFDRHQALLKLTTSEICQRAQRDADDQLDF